MSSNIEITCSNTHLSTQLLWWTGVSISSLTNFTTPVQISGAFILLQNFSSEINLGQAVQPSPGREMI